jgi:hypothetical protein
VMAHVPIFDVDREHLSFLKRERLTTFSVAKLSGNPDQVPVFQL